MAEATFRYMQLKSAYDAFKSYVDSELQKYEEQVKKERYKRWRWKKFRFVEYAPKDVKHFAAICREDFRVCYFQQNYYWHAYRYRYLSKCHALVELARVSTDGLVKLDQSDVKLFCGMLGDKSYEHE